MNDNVFHPGHPHSALAQALQTLKQLQDAGLTVVPSAPSRAMLQAGAEAGDIDLNTAAQVFRAMVEAEDYPPKKTIADVIG